MGKIAVHEFMSLDGVVEDPRWTFDYPFDPKMGEAIGGIMGSTKALLMGRTTYDEFAGSWATRTAEDDAGAPFMNDTPKYVVSGTLETADWSNSTIIGSYDAEAIRSLKDTLDGDIYVSGSIRLVRAMLDDGLVDDLHLFIFPIVLGGSLARLFEEDDSFKLKLEAVEPYASGVVRMSYTLPA